MFAFFCSVFVHNKGGIYLPLSARVVLEASVVELFHESYRVEFRTLVVVQEYAAKKAPTRGCLLYDY